MCGGFPCNRRPGGIIVIMYVYRGQAARSKGIGSHVVHTPSVDNYKSHHFEIVSRICVYS